MERDGRLTIVVGSFVIVATLALAVAILSLTSERGLFVEHYRLISRFDNVQGLLPGAPVWLAGKEVGRVDDIRFEPVGSSRSVLVSMGIDVSIADRIRQDSVATIGTIGVLGDSYVEITVGTAGMPMLAAGAELRAQSPININTAVAKGSRALDNVATLAENLNQVIEGFSRADGGRKAAGAIEEAHDIMARMQHGPGLLHSLIFDEYEGEGVDSIERSLAMLENILGEIRSGDGIMHTLIYENPSEEGILKQVTEAGTRLNHILDKVDRGDGTIGLLLNDPTLYEDVQSLVGGAKRSLVVRSMIRMAAPDEGD